MRDERRSGASALLGEGERSIATVACESVGDAGGLGEAGGGGGEGLGGASGRAWIVLARCSASFSAFSRARSGLRMPVPLWGGGGGGGHW